MKKVNNMPDAIKELNKGNNVWLDEREELSQKEKAVGE